MTYNDVHYDPALCVAFAKNNILSVKESKKVGCYYCLKYFDATRVIEFNCGTALCPRCGRAAIIPDSCIDFDDALLAMLHSY